MNSGELPKHLTTKYVSETVDAIEKWTSRVTWRTSQRIHELVCKDVKNWQNNPFITNKGNFFYVLMQFCFSGSIATDFWRNIYSSSEHYEEWENEPILFEDIDSPKEDTLSKIEIVGTLPRAPISRPIHLLNERFLVIHLKQWMNIELAKEKCRRYSLEDTAIFINMLKVDGLLLENIFYKYPIGRRDEENTTPIPMLPEMI
jgi:hypothetical protein